MAYKYTSIILSFRQSGLGIKFCPPGSVSALGKAEKGRYMSKENCTRNGCKDVFHAFLVQNAVYDGELEFPCLRPELKTPNRLIAFSKAVGSSDYDQWVHFYEDDAAFERIWNHPRKYLPILKKYRGVISPDFSLYRDMPLVMQQWNTYRNRAIAHWLQENGIPVIPNVRFADERSYAFCCDGVPCDSVIAVGSHGCIKLKEERQFFSSGLAHIVQELHPKAIVVYGSAPAAIFGCYRDMGIAILQFDSSFAVSRKAVVA